MNLLQQAAADLRAILEDSAGGFAVTGTLTNPDGETFEVRGFSADIAQSLDPETGLTVSGRTVSIVISRATLAEAGAGSPVAVASSSSRPWTIEVTDASGNAGLFRVADGRPDATLGAIHLQLAPYKR